MRTLELLNPRLRPGVLVERQGADIRIVWSEGCLVLTQTPPAAGAMSVPHFADDLPPALSEIVPLLYFQGLLLDANRPHGPDAWHGVNLLGPILERIRNTAVTAFPDGGILDQMISGRAPKSTVVAWLHSMFHFTDSADKHIGPLLGGGDVVETELWRHFHADEVKHWRIYRRIFAEVGTTIPDARRSPPPPALTAFVDWLEHLARNAPAAYAGSLLFIEQPPTAQEMLDDPLYGALHEHYGFSIPALQPLWLHAVANGTFGHDTLGLLILARRGLFSRVEIEELLANVARTVEALGAVYDEIGKLHRYNSERSAVAR